MKSLLIVLFPVMVFSSCVKKECQIGGSYEFELSAMLTPVQENYSIGDTITIESTFSDLVYERKTDNWIKLEDFNFYPSTEIVKIDSIVANRIISDNFQVIINPRFNYGITSFRVCLKI